ncbi:MAG TPA: tripartite tricarboxylate transporter permease [Alphaproteobacteria bacterium]
MQGADILAAAASVLDPLTLALLAIGVAAGLIAGAIPGFTIAMAVVLTLPFTFGMAPIQGLATMIGVFVGGLSGGLMAAILTGIPGTPSAVATTFDGFPMARGGRPGLALGIGVWASFAGGLISAVILVTLAPVLARIGLEFGPWDYFALIAFALTITASLAGEDILKGLIAGALGLLAATVGEDNINGVARFTFGIDALHQGFAYLPVLIGLFAFSQLMSDVADPVRARSPLLDVPRAAVRIRHRQAIRTVAGEWATLVRSSLIGVFTGILPAAGSSISNILAYDQARKASAHPEQFGTGIPAGIVASESANNATAGGALITMMALGIPGDIVTAVMLGALLIHDVVPSPSFIADAPVLAYGIFIAFFLAHFVMIALQAVCLRGFLLVTRVPMYVLAAVILAYCAVGVFALNNVDFDLWTLLLFGLAGTGLRALGLPLAPMILGVVLGTTAEVNLSRALTISDGAAQAAADFVTRPWSLLFLILAAFSAAFPWYQAARAHARPWTRLYLPAMAVAVSGPLFLMDGWFRPLVGAGLLVAGPWLVWRRLVRA